MLFKKFPINLISDLGSKLGTYNPLVDDSISFQLIFFTVDNDWSVNGASFQINASAQINSKTVLTTDSIIIIRNGSEQASLVFNATVLNPINTVFNTGYY